MTDIFIEGGRVLLGGEIRETSLQIAGGKISAVDSDHGRGSFGLDASDLKVLPGIVDLHGDAFERQMMPRPGVDFPIDVALADSDRQAIANGLTTVFHAVPAAYECLAGRSKSTTSRKNRSGTCIRIPAPSPELGSAPAAPRWSRLRRAVSALQTMSWLGTPVMVATKATPQASCSWAPS